MENLSALRDGTVEGELEYRRQVMRLLGAAPTPNLEPPVNGRRFPRRVEGTVGLVGAGQDGTDLLGLVMFAVGNDGAGALADVRNKDGGFVSARSILVDRPEVDFVLLLTTGVPADDLVNAAEEKSDLAFIGEYLRRRIWVMGLPEVVDRADAFIRLTQAEERPESFFRRVWAWLTSVDEKPVVPRSPLLLK